MRETDYEYEKEILDESRWYAPIRKAAIAVAMIPLYVVFKVIDLFDRRGEESKLIKIER